MHLLKPLVLASLSTLALAQYNNIYARGLQAREALEEAHFDLLEAREAYEDAMSLYARVVPSAADPVVPPQPPKPAKCKTNADCAVGMVCDVDQGKCYKYPPKRG